MRGVPKLAVIAALMLGALALLWYAQSRPGLFSNSYYLGGVLLLEVIFINLWHYERTFLPFLLIVFLWAGMDLPLSGSAGLTVRWVVLGFGALAGYMMWMKHRREQPLTAFHLVAFFCVISALVSAMVSDYPEIALLKVLSLVMLFLYCACGARYAIHGREQQFVRGLVLACELIVYVSAVAYLILGREVYGNRNALGAIIGIATFPVLAWAALATENPRLRRRLGACLLLSGFLLYFSSSRASIAGAVVSGTVLCVVTARRRALLRGAFLVALFLTVAGAINPSRFQDFLAAQTAALVYKHDQTGHNLMASREGPWKATMASIDKHPWFGSGFGTSDMGEEAHGVSHLETVEGSNREHGNSYLAMLEYMGLLGIVPFLGLVLLTIRNVWKVCSWMRHSGKFEHYAVPLAMVVIAGLVHAFFEDWLFAVGNYLCLYFWIAAFALIEFAPASLAVPAPSYPSRASWPVEARFGVPAPGR
jgi:exopolysaccharide production protein ExoQ